MLMGYLERMDSYFKCGELSKVLSELVFSLFIHA
jgi:hypothetical protein